MATTKTAELEGAALDWAVAECEDKRPTIGGAFGGIVFGDTGRNHQREPFSPSTNWAQGGPIIEREELSINKQLTSWTAVSTGVEKEYRGLTTLIAAMRCYVASKLGDTVEVPDKLI